MLVYMDVCALKRPFDDQSQGRVSLETHAVIRILSALKTGAVTVCNSAALEFENSLNTNPVRRERVDILLTAFGTARPASEAVFSRAAELNALGLKDVDALHLAFAEILRAEYFVTCDDSLLRKSGRLDLSLKVMSPVAFVETLNI